MCIFVLLTYTVYLFRLTVYKASSTGCQHEPRCTAFRFRDFRFKICFNVGISVQVFPTYAIKEKVENNSIYVRITVYCITNSGKSGTVTKCSMTACVYTAKHLINLSEIKFDDKTLLARIFCVASLYIECRRGKALFELQAIRL